MTPALRPRTRWQRLAKLAREEGVAVRVNQVTGEVLFLPKEDSPAIVNSRDRDDECDPTYVYFMEEIRSKEIKIGFSRDPKWRRYQISLSTVGEVRILHMEPGTRDDERRYHDRFANYRRHGEWFERTGELAKFLSELKCNPGS